MKPKLKIINMKDVAAEGVKWLWYPYIPYGKVLYRKNHTSTKPPVIPVL